MISNPLLDRQPESLDVGSFCSLPILVLVLVLVKMRSSNCLDLTDRRLGLHNGCKACRCCFNLFSMSGRRPCEQAQEQSRAALCIIEAAGLFCRGQRMDRRGCPHSQTSNAVRRHTRVWIPRAYFGSLLAVRVSEEEEVKSVPFPSLKRSDARE